MIDCKKVIAIVPMSGIGTRMNLDIPKQFAIINDVPLCFYLLRQLQDNSYIDEIALAVPVGWNVFVQSFAKQLRISKIQYIVNGGNTFFNSVKHIIHEIKKTNEEYIGLYVDGDRFIVDDIIEKVLVNYEQYGTTMSYALPRDMVYTSNNVILSNQKKDNIYVVYSPHVYSSKIIDEMLEYANKNNLENCYFNTLAEKLNIKVSFVECSIYNIKVTYLDDLKMVKAFINNYQQSNFAKLEKVNIIKGI